MDQILKIISTLPKYNILTILLSILFIQVKAQDENNFQPDSTYQNHKVKRIYVYENSPRDLSRIIDLDANGHKVKLVDYDASYDRKTRARKKISGTTRYIYDSSNKLIEVIDSASYIKSSKETDQTYFFYDANGVLNGSTYHKNKYVYSHTEYSSDPLKSITTRQNDSLIISKDTEEYDRNFYKKRSYGYSWEPTLKTITTVRGTDTSRTQYSDYKDLKKLDSYDEITNRFNSKGQLISSDIHQRFMVNPDTWRTFNVTLTYNYYANGLLKSIYGYIPKFFKYEFDK
ncbi:hypothetical protein [Mucilaginibacter flavidus]|uniref:hypothetical protein n=1 Tax=Mucilaginibacter flavidus TaxID=2949309 RepID=UPI002093AD61|nr:hypothetical protein [Mucilaginibacter flavidus]MCO5946102.1 hypothetical protein [Mucilaginibacter flavidus]